MIRHFISAARRVWGRCRLGRAGRGAIAAAVGLVGASMQGNPAGSESTTASPRVFRVGASTSNITPLLGVKLDGGIMQIGPARHIHDDLFARCIVFDDGVTRLAFVVCDSTMIANDVVSEAKRLIAEATGMRGDHVMISATHTHSSPRALALGLGRKNDEYNHFFAERIADGVRVAINNLRPAQLGWGKLLKPEFLQTRRWYVEAGSVPPNPYGEKGERVVMGMSPPGKVGPAGPVDPELFVVSVRHADGRPLAVFANYGLHYVGGVPTGDVSADYFGVFSRELSRRLGSSDDFPPFVAVMSNGASGDVVTPRVPAPVYERMQVVGASLAKDVAELCGTLEYRTDITLAAQASELQIAVRKPDAARLEWAKKTFGGAQGGGQLTRPQVYAREALRLADYPDRMPLPLAAYRLGDLVVVAAPCEVFAETGLAIKAGSPYPATFVVELANGYAGYLPTEAQHGLGGYETWPARTSFVDPHAEALIRAEWSRLLRAHRTKR